MKPNWITTVIEDLQAFDVVLHAGSVWVIRRITRNSEGQVFEVTRVDDGKQSKWAFWPSSHGYLMEKWQRH